MSDSETLIERDIRRTFPDVEFFKRQDPDGRMVGRDAMFNVLKAYSLYDSELSYCQGMAFVAAVLVLHMPEEHAFCMLVYLLEEFGLKSMYLPGMEGLQVRFSYAIPYLIWETHI